MEETETWDDFHIFDEEQEDDNEQPEETTQDSVDPESLQPEKLLFSHWCHSVNQYIEQMTDFAECIETVGFFHWWEDWWKDDFTPEVAATEGLINHVMAEDE